MHETSWTALCDKTHMNAEFTHCDAQGSRGSVDQQPAQQSREWQCGQKTAVLHGLPPGSRIAAYFSRATDYKRVEAVITAILHATLPPGGDVEVQIVQRNSFDVLLFILTHLGGLTSANLVASLADAGADSVTIQHPDDRLMICAPLPRAYMYSVGHATFTCAPMSMWF